MLALRDQRELVLAELSRQTHQLVRGMGSEEEIDTLRHARLTGGHSQQETDSFQTGDWYIYYQNYNSWYY